MNRCAHCGTTSALVSMPLGLCAGCIRGDFKRVLPRLRRVHRESRRAFGLPPAPPRDSGGARCRICANECLIPEGAKGYCGLRINRGGRLVGASASAGRVQWYHDPLPTNCVADPFCPGCSAAGYPEFSYSDTAEHGYSNLAVFYNGCSFDCLFCQNWHHREAAARQMAVAPSAVAGAVDGRTSCICFFGGDPAPQLPHALAAARMALRHKKGRILRVCWETNGSMNPRLLRHMMELSLKSGGCIKFDLKTWSEALNVALCGVSNRATLDNFRLAAGMMKVRSDPPPLIASTLLVPGYVDVGEVKAIAEFIASLSRRIPYVLLGFHPCFHMSDLPTTSRSHAEDALAAAQAAGLANVRVGNAHLLSEG